VGNVSSGTSSPGLSQTKGCKTVVIVAFGNSTPCPEKMEPIMFQV